jgi:uncharacterized membrane protein
MELRVSIPADTSPEDVWRLFVDVERWPEMTKSMREVRRLDSGPLQVGSEVVVRQPGLPRTRWRVTELEPGHSFTWESAVGGLTTVVSHIVEADGQGAMIILTLSQHGPLAGVMGVLVDRRARRYVSMEAEGFRRTAESVRSGPV